MPQGYGYRGIWSTYLSFRHIDRFLRTKILRLEYPYVLPGKIQR